MKRCGTLVLPAASMALVCLYPCAFLYCRNAGEARAVDMLPFFGIFLLTALCLFGLAAVVLRNVSRAAFLADLGTLAAVNFTMLSNGIKSVLPGFRSLMLLALVGLVLLVVGLLLLRKKPDMTAACGIVALMFAVMTVVSLIPALPTIIRAASYRRDTGAVDAEIADLVFQGEKRSVYYMIFDEYGGAENLEHYYGYDNEPFLTALEERGFSVSRSSRNTESAWTVTLAPNMLNLQYVTSDDVPILNRLEWLEDPALYQLFRANGYPINLVNQNGFLGETGCRVLTRDQTEETISVYLYENSIFCQIPGLKGVIEERVLHRGEDGYLRTLENAKSAMTDCWREARSGPTLTVCYLVAPHAPFLFDGDGVLTDSSEYYNWKRPELYLAKLEYISAAILEAVDNIQKSDPEAVIILQADHGCRLPGQMVSVYGGPWFDPDAEIPYMENVLNCVYVPASVPGSRDCIREGDTCINTLRRTLDTVFGLDLGILEVPPDYDIPEEYMPPPPDEEERNE